MAMPFIKETHCWFLPSPTTVVSVMENNQKMKNNGSKINQAILHASKIKVCTLQGLK